MKVDARETLWKRDKEGWSICHVIRAQQPNHLPRHQEIERVAERGINGTAGRHGLNSMSTVDLQAEPSSPETGGRLLDMAEEGGAIAARGRAVAAAGRSGPPPEIAKVEGRAPRQDLRRERRSLFLVLGGCGPKEVWSRGIEC